MIDCKGSQFERGICCGACGGRRILFLTATSITLSTRQLEEMMQERGFCQKRPQLGTGSSRVERIAARRKGRRLSGVGVSVLVLKKYTLRTTLGRAERTSSSVHQVSGCVRQI